MNTFVLSFVIFSLMMLAMAVGLLINKREIKGTCGGLNAIDGLEGACDICEVKERCREHQKRLEKRNQAEGR